MPAEFVKCVNSLIKSGKDRNSAYAICTAQYKKRHKGHTPQQDENAEVALPLMFEELESMKRTGNNDRGSAS